MKIEIKNKDVVLGLVFFGTFLMYRFSDDKTKIKILNLLKDYLSIHKKRTYEELELTTV